MRGAARVLLPSTDGKYYLQRYSQTPFCCEMHLHINSFGIESLSTLTMWYSRFRIWCIIALQLINRHGNSSFRSGNSQTTSPGSGRDRGRAFFLAPWVTIISSGEVSLVPPVSNYLYLMYPIVSGRIQYAVIVAPVCTGFYPGSKCVVFSSTGMRCLWRRS